MSALAVPRGRPLKELIEREGRRRRRRRWIGWALLALLPVLAVLGWYRLRPQPVPLAERFRTQTVTAGDLVREVRATGRVEAVTTVLVGSEISGRIESVEVTYNAHVVAGQVLARFDRTSLEAQLAQTNATNKAARASLEQAKTDREQVKRNLARVEKLHAEGAVSDAEYDASRSAATLAEQRVSAAEAQVAAQQAAYSLAKNNLDHTVIKSPIDGVVITRNVDPGQTVASVFQTPVLFSVAADLRKMEVVAAVDEADVGELAEGQPATFTVTAYPKRVFEGVVREVRNSPVVVQQVVTYEAVVAVDNLDLALKPGMTATVKIRTALARDAVRVANGALQFTPAGETASDSAGVWLLEGGALRRVEVKPGITDGELTEIAPGALEPGATVVVDYTPRGKTAYGIGR